MKTETRENKIVDGVIWKQMLLFFFPIFVGTLFQQLYSTVDAVMLGRYVGKGALAAVGGTDAEVICLIVNFFTGLSSGAAVVISQHFGAKHYDALKSSVYTAFMLSIACGALMSVLGIGSAAWLLRAIHTPEDIFHDAVTYLQYYFMGMIPSMIYNMCSGVLRSVGDSRRPLYYLIVCCFLNIILDYLFIRIIPLGVAGAAIATNIAQVGSAALVMRALLRSGAVYKLELRRDLFSTTQLKQMLRIGFPAGVQSSMYSVSNVFVQSSINALHTDSIAAWGAFRKIDGIYWPVANAIGITITTFVGQNFGAQRYDRLKTTIRSGMVMQCLFTIVFTIFVVIFRVPLLSLFTEDAEVLRIGAIVLLGISPFYPLYMVSEVFSGAMRGVGDSLKPAILTLFGTCILRFAYILIFAYQTPSNENIAFCYPLTWAVTSVCFAVYYLRGNWLRRHMLQ